MRTGGRGGDNNATRPRKKNSRGPLQVVGKFPSLENNDAIARESQVTRNLTDIDDGFLRGKRYLILDRDTKYSDAFRSFLVHEGIKIIRLPPRSPNLNAFAERFVRSIPRAREPTAAGLIRLCPTQSSHKAATAPGWDAQLLLSRCSLNVTVSFFGHNGYAFGLEGLRELAPGRLRSPVPMMLVMASDTPVADALLGQGDMLYRRFEILRPNCCRFAYSKLFQQLIVSDGEKAWIHDADLNQVSSPKLSQVLGSTPAALLTGGSMDEDFLRGALPDKDRARVGAGDSTREGRPVPVAARRLQGQGTRSNRDPRQLRPALAAAVQPGGLESVARRRRVPLYATRQRRGDRAVGRAARRLVGDLNRAARHEPAASGTDPARRARSPRCDRSSP